MSAHSHASVEANDSTYYALDGRSRDEMVGMTEADLVTSISLDSKALPQSLSQLTTEVLHSNLHAGTHELILERACLLLIYQYELMCLGIIGRSSRHP